MRSTIASHATASTNPIPYLTITCRLPLPTPYKFQPNADSLYQSHTSSNHMPTASTNPIQVPTTCRQPLPIPYKFQRHADSLYQPNTSSTTCRQPLPTPYKFQPHADSLYQPHTSSNNMLTASTNPIPYLPTTCRQPLPTPYLTYQPHPTAPTNPIQVPDQLMHSYHLLTYVCILKYAPTYLLSMQNSLNIYHIHEQI